MWSFDERRHLLTDGARERRLEPKAVAVLARLAETPGEVVAKEELLEAAWPGQYVTEEVLANAIYQVRRALDDDARKPRYVETIPKRGYRLIGQLESSEAPRATEPAAPAVRRWIAAVLVGLLMGIVGGSLADRSTTGDTDPRLRPAELVDRGWDALDSSRSGGAEEALVLAREALALDPDDPDAWALSAVAWADRAASGSLPDAPQGYATALEAVERALALSPGHAPALAARARARWLGSWDWAGAEADLVTALSRSPESASVWTDFAELLFFSERLDEARAAVDRALERSPGSVRARMTSGLVASFAGDSEAAARQYRAVLARHPGHPAARTQLAKLDRPSVPRSPGERLEGLTAKNRVRPGHVALWHLESGDDASALAWMERAVEEHDPTILFFRFDRSWDRLRDHPRYRAAMRNAGIPQP